MAEIHGVAGEWARVKGSVMGLWPLFLGVFAAGFSVAMCIVSPALGISLLVMSLGFVMWSLMIGLKRVERFFKGARGEERVSGILKSLPASYHVFNDFNTGRVHVDHVVVGPGGVFAVETKFWKGKVTIEDGHILLDGQLPDRSPVSQVLREVFIGAVADAQHPQAVPLQFTAEHPVVFREVRGDKHKILHDSQLHSSQMIRDE